MREVVHQEREKRRGRMGNKKEEKTERVDKEQAVRGEKSDGSVREEKQRY